jgi:hypothetical protein
MQLHLSTAKFKMATAFASRTQIAAGSVAKATGAKVRTMCSTISSHFRCMLADIDTLENG